MNPLLQLKKQFKSGEIAKAEYISKMYQHHHSLHNFKELLQQSEVASLLICDEGVIATMRDDETKILLTAGDERLAPLDALNFGVYEREELEMVLNLLNGAKCMFDIGANVGWYSLKCAARYPELQINAFEPLPRTYQYLQRNLSLNKVSSIKTYNSGFSDKEEEISFFFDPKGSVNASMRNVADKTDIQEIKCKVERLDNFIEKTKSKIDFIKCDVEGAELLVLKGAVETLKSQQPFLFVEMLRKWAAKFGYHPNEIIELMLSIGYKCFTVSKDRLLSFQKMDDSTTATNFIFLHGERHKEQIASLKS